jgi:large subunit ribosomal protein L31
MKSGIHPTWYDDALVVCACGNTWRTGSTKKEIHTDVCSSCHPFYTGEQRIVDTAGQVERFMKRVSAKEQLAPKPEEQVKPTKKERRARARGDMRSGMRRVQPAAVETAEPAAKEAAPAAEAAEAQVPEAIMIAPTPAGRVWDPVSVEPVESAPAVEPAAPVSESAVESEARTPTAEVVVGEPVETVQEMTHPAEVGEVSVSAAPQAAVVEGSAAEARAPQPVERPPRPRNRPPRASTQGQGEETHKPRPPRPPRPEARGGGRKPRAEKPPEPPAENPAEPAAESIPPGEGAGTE